MKRLIIVLALLSALAIGALWPIQTESAQFIDRIVRPCSAGAVPLANVTVNPLGNGNVNVVPCTGGSLTVNGVAVVPGAGGTVTSVSVVTANGFSGSVATATTTPAITINNPTALVATTSITAPFFASAAANPADTNALRLGNNEFIAWEKAAPGTDWTLGVNASDVLVSSAPFAIGAGAAITSSGAGGALGTAAFQNTGTSGANIPFLNGINTWGAPQTIANGTITVDTPPLVITETRNAAGVTFNGFKYTITDTASASASLVFQILGGAAGTTNLIKVDKIGLLTVPAFTAIVVSATTLQTSAIARLNALPTDISGGQTTDGASNVAVNLRSYRTFATAGAKIVSFQNNTTEMAFIDKDGGLSAVNGTLSGTVVMPGLATSSAATTGTVCWTTGTGLLNVDTTTTCLLSSGRFKQYDRPLTGGLDTVLQLRPKSYFLKDEYNPTRLGEQEGFFAEDVFKVDPRLVSLESDGSPHAVRYQQLSAQLTLAIQQLNAKVEAQQREIDTLKARRK